MKEEIEKRRVEAAERMKTLSSSSIDGEEVFSPISPKVSTQKVPASAAVSLWCLHYRTLTLDSDCCLFSDKIQKTFKYGEVI